MHFLKDLLEIEDCTKNLKKKRKKERKQEEGKKRVRKFKSFDKVLKFNQTFFFFQHVRY